MLIVCDFKSICGIQSEIGRKKDKEIERKTEREREREREGKRHEE